MNVSRCYRLIALFVLAIVVFAACQSNVVQETAVLPKETATEVVTKTAVLPISTSMPTATRTPPPTQTLIPTQTAVPTATPSPVPTLVPVSAGTPVHEPSGIITLENVEQLTELAHWGRGMINDVAYSGNGRWIAVGTATGVYIHDAQELDTAPIFFETSSNVELVDISFNGDMIAMVFGTDRAELWKVATREQIWATDGNIFGIQFAPDNQSLAVYADGIMIWSIPDGNILQHYPDAYGVQFSHDGEKLAIWDYGTLSVYQWPTGDLISQTKPILYTEEPPQPESLPFGTTLSDVQFTIEGDQILLNLPNNPDRTTGRVEIQQASDDALLLSLPPIPSLAAEPIVHACNEPLVFGDGSGHPQVWQFELASDAQIIALKYTDVGYGDDKKYTNVQFHQLVDGEQVYTQEGVAGFAFSPDGETWVSGLYNGRLQIRRITDGELLQEVDSYDSLAFNAIISPDSQMVAVTYVDEVKLYAVEDGTMIRQYPAVRAAFSLDSSAIALGYENGHIELRAIDDDFLLNTFNAHTESIIALTFMPSGEELISAGMDCQLNVWQLQSGEILHQLENNFVESGWLDEDVALRVWDMMIAYDGNLLIGRNSRDITIWDIQDGSIQNILPQPSLNDAAYSPHDNYLVTIGYGSPSWKLSTTGEAQEIGEFGHGAAIAISPDGKLILISQDKSPADRSITDVLRLRSIPDNELLHMLLPSTRKVTAVDFAPNGRYFVSAALDGVVRLWGVP